MLVRFSLRIAHGASGWRAGRLLVGLGLMVSVFHRAGGVVVYEGKIEQVHSPEHAIGIPDSG